MTKTPLGLMSGRLLDQSYSAFSTLHAAKRMPHGQYHSLR